MQNIKDLGEAVAKIIPIVEKMEKDLAVYEEKVLAIEPKMKELGEIEARIVSVREETEQLHKAIESAKKDHAAFRATLK